MMAETLLSSSTVLLFGRLVKDLVFGLPNNAEVDAATTENMTNLRGLGPIDGVTLTPGKRVLVHMQKPHTQNGIYVIAAGTGNPWNTDPNQPEQGAIIKVNGGDKYEGSWERMPGNSSHYKFRHLKGKSRGKNNFLERQSYDMVIARIYSFSYEGNYYNLPKTILFGVHGEGEPAVLSSNIIGPPTTDANLSRAPQEPSITGVAAADFEFADDVRVWSYDKADYTIRMDVETGMFEQVLLDAFFDGGGGGGRVSGAMVSGAMVGGPSARGAMVRGAMVSGAMLRGRRGGRGDPSD